MPFVVVFFSFSFFRKYNLLKSDLLFLFPKTGSADKTVKFWDLETFEMIGSSGPEVKKIHWIYFTISISISNENVGHVLLFSDCTKPEQLTANATFTADAEICMYSCIINEKLFETVK